MHLFLTVFVTCFFVFCFCCKMCFSGFIFLFILCGVYIFVAGFYFGIFLLILVAYLTDYGVRNLVASGVRKYRYDYELITEWAFGSKGYYLIVIFMFLFAYGAMVAYHVVIGDTVPGIITTYGGENVTDPFDQRWFIVVLFSVCFMLPLSLLKHMASLSITSFFSVFSVFFIVAAVCIETPGEANKLHNEGKIEYTSLYVLLIKNNT